MIVRCCLGCLTVTIKHCPLRLCIWSVNWLSSRSFAFPTMTRAKLLGDVHRALDIPLPIWSFGFYPYWLLHNRRPSTSGTFGLRVLLWITLLTSLNICQYCPYGFTFKRYFRSGFCACELCFCSSAFRVRLLKDWLTIVILESPRPLVSNSRKYRQWPRERRFAALN